MASIASVKGDVDLILKQKWTSWSNFSRNTGAAKVNELLEPGNILEINDSMFKNQPVVVLRKDDLEQLIDRSRQSSGIKNILMSLRKMMRLVKKDNANTVLEAVDQQLIAVEMMSSRKPLFSRGDDLFASELEKEADDNESFSITKEELSKGVAKHD